MGNKLQVSLTTDTQADSTTAPISQHIRGGNNSRSNSSRRKILISLGVLSGFVFFAVSGYLLGYESAYRRYPGINVVPTQPPTPVVNQDQKWPLSSDKYLFLEQHLNVSGESVDKDCNVGLMIDFPTYSFDLNNGVLKNYGVKLDVNEELKIVYGSGSSRSGAAGGGAATGLIGIYEIPYTGKEFSVRRATNNGTVYLNYQGNEVILKIGEEWKAERTEITDTSNCQVKLIYKDTIKNYGIFDKDTIESKI